MGRTQWHIVWRRKWKLKFHFELDYNMDSQTKQEKQQQSSQEQTEKRCLKGDHVEVPWDIGRIESKSVGLWEKPVWYFQKLLNDQIEWFLAEALV